MVGGFQKGLIAMRSQINKLYPDIVEVWKQYVVRSRQRHSGGKYCPLVVEFVEFFMLYNFVNIEYLHILTPDSAFSRDFECRNI